MATIHFKSMNPTFVGKFLCIKELIIRLRCTPKFTFKEINVSLGKSRYVLFNCKDTTFL